MKTSLFLRSAGITEAQAGAIIGLQIAITEVQKLIDNNLVAIPVELYDLLNITLGEINDKWVRLFNPDLKNNQGQVEALRNEILSPFRARKDNCWE
jgi:hypothetical protein